ncbi:hypothetical protein DV735_g1708, partial [Chaetothyriales sp. CBS 134920]
MPLIEELPLSTPSRAQPGWAYVPEISNAHAAAAAAAAAQTTSRKRNRGVDTLGSQSAKQQKAIEQRLKDLEKENYKDVQIAIPKREGGNGSQAGSQRDSKKTASNARRILGYNRTFAHYLADEEAALQAGQPPYYMQGMSNIKTEQSEDVSMTGLSTSQTPVKSPASQAPKSSPSSAAAPAVESANAAPPSYPPQWDADPLLRTLSLPVRPSERVIQKLLAEPPLSWNEARAKPMDAEKQTVPPPRHFCIMCGYWGKIKCRKCAERVCGAIECWRTHEAAGGCGDRPY